MIKKPMLAAKNPNLSEISFPVIASPKLDGIRCLMLDNAAVSRTLKPIPNDYVRTYLEAHCPNGLDGELIVEGSFNDVQSAIMAKDGQPDFKYMVFDYVAPCEGSEEKEYIYRLSDLEMLFMNNTSDKIVLVPVIFCETIEQLEFVMRTHLVAGYEGTMIRSPESPYKNGRATLKEGYLTAIKPFEDGEAEIIGFEEQQENKNVATKDALGHTERSSHKNNKHPKATLGAFIVRAANGEEFKIGTGKGLTKKLRQEIWDNKESYLGKLVHYRHQAHGAKSKPRIPSFHGFRSKEDI